MIQKIYYVTHSCFVVECEDRYLVFDYFDNAANRDICEFNGHLPEFSKEKKLYVFSSHGHRDHWDINCLKWAEDREDVKYILSKHIRLGHNYLVRNGINPDVKKQIKFVSPVEEYKVDDMEIETFRSTDEGVAFLVTVNGQRIYHAGDLHWWTYFERGELYGDTIGRAYKRELHRLNGKHIDVGFVVLDGRLPENTRFYGINHFLKNVNCDVVFPMHMWNNYSLIGELKKQPEVEGRLLDKVVDLEQENMCFEMD